jgi:hypothetical protein
MAAPRIAVAGLVNALDSHRGPAGRGPVRQLYESGQHHRWRHAGNSRHSHSALGDWLVRNGLALDWPEYSKRKYDAAQRDAEQAGRGIWRGSYVEPWLYRVCIRANGTPANCSDDANAHP